MSVVPGPWLTWHSGDVSTCREYLLHQNILEGLENINIFWILRIVSSLMHFTINWFLIEVFTFSLNSSLLLMSWKPIQTSTLPWKIVFFLQLKSFYDRIIPRYWDIPSSLWFISSPLPFRTADIIFNQKHTFHDLKILLKNKIRNSIRNLT